MNKILEKLKGGDLRSIGRADEVVQDILKDPQLFPEVFEGMFSNDPVIRMRSSDAIEKVSREHPEYLQTFKNRLIDKISKIEQKEVRWHVAQMFSYLEVNEQAKNQIIHILYNWIDRDKSKIVKVNSMQTITDFAEKDNQLKVEVIHKLEEIMKTGSPAMISRSKKLLKKLKRS